MIVITTYLFTFSFTKQSRVENDSDAASFIGFISLNNGQTYSIALVLLLKRPTRSLYQSMTFELTVPGSSNQSLAPSPPTWRSACNTVDAPNWYPRTTSSHQCWFDSDCPGQFPIGLPEVPLTSFRHLWCLFLRTWRTIPQPLHVVQSVAHWFALEWVCPESHSNPMLHHRSYGSSTSMCRLGRSTA